MATAANADILLRVREAGLSVIGRAKADIAGLKTAGQELNSVLGKLGIGLSFAAVGVWIRSTIDGLDALNDAADATGSSIEKLSGLENIGAATGTSFETVASAVIKLNQVLNSATPKSPQAEALKAIGLSANELRQIDPSEALRKVALALAGYADDGNKARLVQELLGKSARELAPFLKDLAEGGELVGTVTKEQAEAADAYNKQLFALQKNAADAARYLANDLVTGVNNAAEAFRNSGLAEGLRVLFFGSQEHRNNVRLVELTEKMLLAESGIAKLKAAGFADDSARVKSAQAALDAINGQIRGLQQIRNMVKPADYQSEAESRRLGLRGPTPVPLNWSGGSGGGPAKQSEAERYLETLQQQLEKTQNLTALEQLLADIMQGRFKGATTEQQRQAATIAMEIDARKAAAEAKKKEADEAERMAKAQQDAVERSWQLGQQYIEGLQRENQAHADNNKSLRESIEEMGLTTEQLGKLRVARLDEAIATREQELAMTLVGEAGQAEIEQLVEKIRLLKEQRVLTQAGTDRQVQLDADKMAEDAGQQLNSEVKQALSNAFRDTSGNPVKAFAAALGNVVYTRLTERTAAALADALVGTGKGGDNGLLGGIFGSIGSWFQGLFSADGGGYTGSGTRSGGLDGKGGFLALLHPQETVLDHTKGQASGSVINNYTINIDSRADRAQIMADMQRLISRNNGRLVEGARRQEIYG